MALTQVNAGLIDSTSQPNSFKNRIINGAMMIDQRNAGASVTPTYNSYGLDRWSFPVSQNSKLTAQQSSTAPSGFVNSMAITSSSAYSVLSSDYFAVQQRIEGLNVSDLAWGTANAQPVTISFWVRCSLTGTFGGVVGNSNGSRNYPFAYTISAANTFEYKTVTVPGDVSGTWLTTNGVGLILAFGLGAGSTWSGTAGAWTATQAFSVIGATSVVGTNGATFYITGVQLEKGSTATSFDYRPYGTELALCQRYYETLNTIGNQSSWMPASIINSNSIYCSFMFKVPKRATPSTAFGDTSNWQIYSAGAYNTVTATSIDSYSITNTVFTFNTSSGAASGNSCIVRYTGSGINVYASSEL